MNINKILPYINKHPNCIDQYKFGNFADLYNSINMQLVSDNKFIRDKTVILPFWIVLSKGFLGNSFELIHNTHLLHFYIQALTKQQMYGLLNETNYSIIIRYYLRNNFYERNVETDEEDSSNILNALSLISPWSYRGWNGKLESEWRSNPQNILAAVNERLIQYTSTNQTISK
jgi:hypothetical protein